MATSVDHKLAAAFTIILILYAVITFGTWISLESQNYRSEVLDVMSSDAQSVVMNSHPVVASIQSKLDNTADLNRVIIAKKSDTNRQDNVLPKAPSSAVAAVVPKRSTVKVEDISDVYTLQHTFPIHATVDVEIIDHPGILLANKEKMEKVLQTHPTLPVDGKMTVPKFWNPTCYGPQGVRQFLGDHGQRLITPEEAEQIGSYSKDGYETIFVSVASYRDPECQPTVEDIFVRAEYPERIRVAVVDQRASDDTVPPCGRPTVPCSQEPEQIMCKFAHLIDVYDVDAMLSVGPVFARHLANRLYRGEYFAMQVDSHVRFIEHWDTNLLGQWKSAKNEMAVITTYLSDISNSIDPVTHANTHPGRPIMCKTGYEGQGKLKHLRHGQQPEGSPGIHGEPTLHPFWAAGFSFARGHFVVQVPYDQYEPMVFQGEEIFMGLRGFTYGYDYYTAEISVAFHMYAIKENMEKRKKVKLFWENSDLYQGSAVEGMKRLNGIIGNGDKGDTYYDVDELKYGLGQIRPKEQFYKLYGIHTDTKTVEDHLCAFVGIPMQTKFKPYLRKNRMGIDFSKVEFEYKDPNPPKPAASESKNPGINPRAKAREAAKKALE
jgi:[Skp1-protein]-hydroxyproline N-acetylglucosaminyltransferase